MEPGAQRFDQPARVTAEEPNRRNLQEAKTIHQLR